MSERSLTEIAADLGRCAANWEPGARLLGNVEAREIVRLCEVLPPLLQRILAWERYFEEPGDVPEFVEIREALGLPPYDPETDPAHIDAEAIAAEFFASQGVPYCPHRPAGERCLECEAEGPATVPIVSEQTVRLREMGRG